MNACIRCSLVFDAEPVEIGRSAIDPNYCILCEGSIMITSTHTKTIKVHTLIIDDNECERYIDDPDSFINLLNDLLNAKPDQPNGHAPRQKTAHPKDSKKWIGRKKPEREPCQSCGESIPIYRQGKHKCKLPALASVEEVVE